MASNPQSGRKVLIVAVAAALVGTLGLMVAAMRPAATVALHWPRLSGTFNQHEKTRTDRKSEPLSADVHRLEIVTDGSVRVAPGPAGNVSVEATVHAFGSSDDEAAKALTEADWRMGPPEGDTLKLNGNAASGKMAIRINGTSYAQPAHTDFVVHAPPGLRVIVRGDAGSVAVVGMAGADLKTDSGSIEVAGLTGDLTAEADSGSVSARDLKGDVKATTDSGSVTVVNAGGTVKAEADSGSIRVERAARATLRCDHGQIEARHVAGALEAETSTGRIVAEDVGAGARLTSEHGSIDARRIHNGRLAATTETGAIDLDQPGITDVDYDLRTEHGSVALAVPKTAALTVDLKSEHGHIQEGLGLPAPSEPAGGGQTVTGRLGDGKRRLAITSETGSIDLRAAT
jgi:DUF4097 and DUF4098 domain-containing protein YvlB